MVNDETTAQAVHAMVVRRLHFDAVPFEDSDSLFDDLGLDSLDALEITLGLEQDFGIDDVPNDPAIFKSVNTLASFVDSKREAHVEHR